MTDERFNGEFGIEPELISNNLNDECFWSQTVEIEAIDIKTCCLKDHDYYIINEDQEPSKIIDNPEITKPIDHQESNSTDNPPLLDNFWQNFIYGFSSEDTNITIDNSLSRSTTLDISTQSSLTDHEETIRSLSTEDSGIESLDSTPLDNEHNLDTINDLSKIKINKNGVVKRSYDVAKLNDKLIDNEIKKKRIFKSREVIVGDDDSSVIIGDFGVKRVTRLDLKKCEDKPKVKKVLVDKTIGKLVWAFWRKWWPAIIIKPEDAGMFASTGKIWVFWIGESRLSEVNEECVEAFSSDFKERLDRFLPQPTIKESKRKEMEKMCFKTIQLVRPHLPNKILTKPYALWLKKTILSDEEKNKKILDDLVFYPYPEDISEKLEFYKKQNSGKTKKYLIQLKQEEINKSTEIAPSPKKLIKNEKLIASGGINIKDQKPGMIVWAKLEGYSWWPCVIMDYQKINQRQPYVAHQWVLWYEDYMHSQIEFRQIISFLKGIEKMKSKIESSKDTAFSRAVLQASKDFCEKTQCSVTFESISDVIKFFYNSRNRFKIKDKQLDLISEDSYSKVIQDHLRDQVRSTPVGQKRKDQILNSKMLKLIFNGEAALDSICIMCFSQNELKEHPFFNASLCNDCLDDYIPQIFAYGIDRKCFFCCLCGNDDLVAVCDNLHCPKVFCTACIKYIFCPDLYEDILLKHPWECFICNPNQLIARKEIIKIREDWKTRSDSVYRDRFDGETSKNVAKLGGNTKIRVLSLFDGIGTGLLVLKNLNIEVECYYSSEIDPDSMEVSKFNHGKDIIQLGDIRNIDEKKIKEICPFDLVIGGSPCNELSLANPKRRGLDDPAGTGVLFYEYCRLLKLVRKHNKKKHLFWLFENVASMPKKYRDQISEHLGREPKFLDSADFSAQHRPRLFWSNLPWGYFEKTDVYLQDMLHPNCNREALVKKIMTVTTRSNSINQTKENIKPVLMDGEPDTLWVTELEQIFGFPRHYTDVNISKTRRQQLLGKAWSVQTLEAIFRNLFYLIK